MERYAKPGRMVPGPETAGVLENRPCLDQQIEASVLLTERWLKPILGLP